MDWIEGWADGTLYCILLYCDGEYLGRKARNQCFNKMKDYSMDYLNCRILLFSMLGSRFVSRARIAMFWLIRNVRCVGLRLSGRFIIGQL